MNFSTNRIRGFVINDGVLLKYKGRKKDVIIPDSVREIGYRAFCECSKLNSVVIPDSVSHIGSHAFALCENLESITMPNGSVTFGGGVFVGCEKLRDKDGLVIVGNVLFDCFSDAERIDIPEGVVKIEEFAFSNCKNLRCVNVPDSVTEINRDAFFQCYGLQETGLVIVANTLFDCFSLCAEVVVPNSVTRICSSAFSIFAENLTAVTIPGSVSEIGKSTFDDCEKLTSVKFLEGVEKIGADVFVNCNKLKTVAIPSSVTKIHKFAFRNCPKAVIHTPAGSFAESYAKVMDIPFVTE